MRQLIRRMVAVAGLAAALALPATSIFAQTVSDIEAKKKIVIGVLTGIPPYDTVDASGNTDGFLADLARAVAKQLGVDVELVPVNNASRAAALESGRVDMLVAQMTATPERAKMFLMTNPYGAYEMRFVAAKARRKHYGVHRWRMPAAALALALIVAGGGWWLWSATPASGYV